MGELEEKEVTASAGETATPHVQESTEEPKETDHMLEKRDDTELTHSDKFNQSNDNKKKTILKPLTPPTLNSKQHQQQQQQQQSQQQQQQKKDTVDDKKLEEIINVQQENVHIEKSNEQADNFTPKVTTVQIERDGGGGGDDEGEEDGTGDGDKDGDETERNGIEEKKMSTEDREVKPKKIPIGGLKLPGFFMKSKPKPDGDGADGELLEKEQKSDTIADNRSETKKEEKPSRNFGTRLRNFFMRKANADKESNKLKATATPNDIDNKSEVTADAGNTDGRDGQQKKTGAGDAPPQKRGLLNAIKLPIANMIPKKSPEDDVELGLSKAGLASMETLDDSLKDQDCVDKASTNKNNGVDEISKLKKTPSSGDIMQVNDEKTIDDEEDEVRPMSFCQRLRAYKCSLDDILICLGIVLFLLLIAVIAFALTHETLIGPPIREGRFVDAITGCGMVEGIKEDGVFTFRGIPFAQAPLGERRWRPAQAIEGIEDCWNGTLSAHNSSAVCSQTLGNGTIVGDEDCLYLDVITPYIRYDTPLPVVVLIGAETLTGPSPGILEPSTRQAREQNVIFVRPNFRLGVFGFLALDILTKDSYPHSSGNYALTDIIAALQWVKLNIAHFGGDANSVTLFGYRAGGTLVAALVTSKKMEELYTRAWISSASAIYPGKPLSESEKRNEKILQALECQNVECLRMTSVEKIWAATPDTWLYFPGDIPTVEENTTAHHEWLVLDGDILQEHPAESWKKEHNNGGSPKLVMGTTAHESHTEKLRARVSNWTTEQVRNYLENSKIGALNLTDEAIQRYNATSYRDVIAMITDIRTICPLLINVRLQPSVPFYVVTQGSNDDQLLATVDADATAILGNYTFKTDEQRRYVTTMAQLFYHYVTYGKLPQYDPRRRVINISTDALSQEDYPNCNFWITNDIVPRYARID